MSPDHFETIRAVECPKKNYILEPVKACENCEFFISYSLSTRMQSFSRLDSVENKEKELEIICGYEESSPINQQFTPIIIPSQTHIQELIPQLEEAREILNLSTSTINQAIRIMQLLNEEDYFIEESSIFTLASCIYIAGIQTGDRVTQLEVARAFNIDTSEIRGRFKEIVSYLE